MLTAMRVSSHTHTHTHAGMRKGTSRHTSCAVQRMRSPGADEPHTRPLHASGRFSTGAKASVCGHSLWRVCDSMHRRFAQHAREFALCTMHSFAPPQLAAQMAAPAGNKQKGRGNVPCVCLILATLLYIFTQCSLTLVYFHKVHHQSRSIPLRVVACQEAHTQALCMSHHGRYAVNNEMGIRNQMDIACRHFASRGFVAITMVYRLTNKQTGVSRTFHRSVS